MLEFLLIGFYVFVTVVVAPMVRGWVLSLLWAWFMVPNLHVPAIGIAQALGIMYLYTFFNITHIMDTPSKAETDTKDMDKNEKYLHLSIRSIVYLFTTCSLVLIMGWIIKQFM
jgi:putative Mn2+ efflux pump MntP